MEIFYSQGRKPPLKRQVFKNPRHFTVVEPKAKKVMIDGDWPEVEAAYKAASVKVEHFDASAAEGVEPTPHAGE